MHIASLNYVKKRAGGHIVMQLSNDEKVEIDPELVVRFHLKKGMELSAESLAELQLEQHKLTARRAIVRYLSLRKKSRREAELYLERRGFPPAAVEPAISAASELGLLNDTQYAEAFVRTQVRSSSKGPRAIEQELRMRGVHKEIAAEVIQPQATPETQRERALAAGRKKVASLRDDAPTDAFRKLYAFLMRKGYDGDICGEVSRELLGSLDDEQIGLE